MKKQITPITGILGAPLKLDARECWRDFLALGSRERLEAADTFHFMVQLPWMELPLEIKERFWNAFARPEAEKARQVATNGTKATNHESEMNLATVALRFQEKREAGRFKTDTEAAKTAAFGVAVEFSQLVADMVESGDTAPLRRLAAVIEEKGLPIGDRGGISSEDGFMLEKFAELHAATRSLPTKAELRKACGLNSLADKKLADKRMKKLGLSGLPTEPEI